MSSFRELQHEARERSMGWLDRAAETEDAKEAGAWSLAAKNAVAVAVSCETVLKIQGERAWVERRHRANGARV